MPQILSTLLAMVPRSKRVTVLRPWLFINTTRNNPLCSDFRPTPLSDISGLLLCDAHPFIYTSQLCLSQLVFDRSPVPLSAFRGERHRSSHQCSAACPEQQSQCSCRQVLRQRDRCLIADPRWKLVLNGVIGVEGLESLRCLVGRQVKGQTCWGAVSHWEGQPLGPAGSASALLCEKSVCRELNPHLEGIKDFINPWLNAGDEFRYRSTACHFEKGKLTQT